MSVMHKISGFVTAVILAILSFLIIYFFCPHFSQRAFGISLKKNVSAVEVSENNVKESFDKTVDKTIEKTEKVVKNVTQKIEKIDLSHLLDD